LFSGNLAPDVGDGDYTKPQDDIDHDFVFGHTDGHLTEPDSGDTLSLSGLNKFYGPPGNELVTSER
jgi:hypothetical protein